MNGWEAKARLEKAIALEHTLRLAGCVTTDDLDGLDGDGRRNAEAAAGLVRASAETWSEVRRLFLDYDAGRAAVGSFE